MAWTDERIDTLKKLWTEGLSASQIAKQLGSVTRNAVIGKIHRLGLAGRATAYRPAKRPRVVLRKEQRAAKAPPAPIVTTTAAVDGPSTQTDCSAATLAMRHQTGMYIDLAMRSLAIRKKPAAASAVKVSAEFQPITPTLVDGQETANLYACHIPDSDSLVVAHARHMFNRTDWTFYAQSPVAPKKDCWKTDRFKFSATRLHADDDVPNWLIEAQPIVPADAPSNLPMTSEWLADLSKGLQGGANGHPLTLHENWTVPPAYINITSGFTFPVNGTTEEHELADALPDAFVDADTLLRIGLLQPIDEAGLKAMTAPARVPNRPKRKPNAGHRARPTRTIDDNGTRW